MARSTDPLLIARIGKPHGLRGEVTVQTHTDDPETRYVPGATFDTEAAPGTGVPRTLTVATARKHREIWLLGFDEIPDRTGAESLRGTQLFLDADTVDEAESDEDDGWYEHDLVGLAVHDPEGVVLGEVTGLVIGAVQDLLEVRLVDRREVLVPFVEAIVTEVDTEAGHVVVDAPAGLFDLDEA
ncbi:MULTISPECIES: ribosome maturation factor RimM [unclassified Knoellia]|uniref:ribosome maturation factor RimM n=1 Tax=Knoellia altitudinis TaxID=3404795 RepID=UPI00361E9D5E